MTPDLSILFVDDEPEVLKALYRTVQHAGWPVTCASGPEEGLRYVEAQEYAVVVSDFRMPKMDGVAFLGKVKERWPDTERLLLTAYADEGALERGINEAGISRFLRKPWKREVLVGILQKALDECRMRREYGVLVERIKNRNEELSYLNDLLQSRVEESDRAILSFRRRWDVALNAISDPVVIIGENYRLEGCNSAAAARAEMPAEKLEGHKCHSAIFGNKNPCTGCPLGSGTGRVSVEHDQKAQIFDARAYRLPGAVPSHICVYRDITREVAFEAEAAQMEKMAAVGRLAGGVAHEINNPLHGILSFVQLAQKSGVPQDKLARYHEVIYDCAIRCRDIVQALRDFSRQAKPGEQKLVPIAEVIDKALMFFEGQHELAFERAERAPGARCLGNANQLLQVIINLLQNAIDASPRGGTIAVITEAEGPEVLLAVEDQGTGVPPQIREKIFEPFFTTKPEGVGTGLGLAISHNIMREHGGSLRVTKAALGGARFEARLPISAG